MPKLLDDRWKNVVISELKDIEEAHGKINPALVVESSKNKKSILHSFFEWDNEKAANSFRKSQAAEIIRHIEVKVIKNGETLSIRAYDITKRDNLNGNSIPVNIPNTISVSFIPWMGSFIMGFLI